MYISVDIEADGPSPANYSMLSIGAVVIEPSLKRTFYAELEPLTKTKSAAVYREYIPEAQEASGFTRRQVLDFPDAEIGIKALHTWLTFLKQEDNRLTFTSDNPVFDGMFIWYYFDYFDLTNPFGFSGFSLTSFAKGWERDMRKNHKRLRQTKHTHNALDDALGNAEAFLAYQKMGLRL